MIWVRVAAEGDRLAPRLAAAVGSAAGARRQSLADLYVHLHLALLDERINDYERRIVQLARQNEATCRLMAITGIGPLIALAMVATVGDARSFDSGRQFAAWLGLVPKQWSSGGKIRLGRITRRGDAYLRMLLTLGARSAILTRIMKAVFESFKPLSTQALQNLAKRNLCETTYPIV